MGDRFEALFGSSTLPAALSSLVGFYSSATSSLTALLALAGLSPSKVRMRRLEALSLRAAEGSAGAGARLCTVLRDRKENEFYRRGAAYVLAGARYVPEARLCLSAVASDTTDLPVVRYLATLSLANIGGAEACRALLAILQDSRNERIIVRASGEEHSLQDWAAMFLEDFENLNGQAALDAILRQPQEYLTPWELAMKQRYHADEEGYLALMLEIVQGHRHSTKLGVTVLEVYAILLSQADWSTVPNPKPWWDSLVAISLAKQTEAPEIRRAADEYLSRYRPYRYR